MTTLLASAGLLAAVRVASADIGAQVTYLCATPKATYPVVLGIKAKVPTAGKTNTPVRIGDVGVTLKAPGRLRGEFAATEVPDSTGAAPEPSLSGVASIAVTVNQGQTSVNAAWPAFSLTADPARTEEMVLRGSGAVPALLTDQAGQVFWKAGQMVLRLSAEGRKASISTLTCLPKSGIVLGKLALKGGTAPSVLPKRSPMASQPKDDTTSVECHIPPAPTEPGGGINRDPRLAEPPIPPGMNLSRLFPERPGTPNCGKAAGFGNLGKLKAAIPIGAQISFRMSVQNQIDFPHNYMRSRNYGVTATTPSTGTALGFGFMPTTATVLTKQVAPPGASSEMANLFADSHLGNVDNPTSFPIRAFARSFVDLRVGGISVNGTPVDVGKTCHTGALPLDLSADLGNDRVGKLSPQEGGTYTGSVYVPAFSGCGVGEDLTPLVDATSAGASNFLKIESGRWCPTTPESPDSCDSPEPQAFTVLPGGAVKATAGPFIMRGSSDSYPTPDPDHVGDGVWDNTIRCESATFQMHFKRGRYLSRYRIATIDGANFKKCVRFFNGVSTNVTTVIRGAGLPWTLHMDTQKGPGQWFAMISGVKLDVTGSDGCSFSLNRLSEDLTTDVPGTLSALEFYADKNRLHIPTAEKDGPSLVVGTTPQCALSNPDFQSQANWSFVAADFSFAPYQKITSP
ncbi:DUF6801 domain-containing protein [Spirillospora sp. NPDC049652]